MNDNKLKIAMLSAHSCPVGDLGAKDTGGMSVYIRELARELGRQGHTVDIFTRVHDPADSRVEVLSEGVRLIHLRAGAEATIKKMDVYCSLPEFVYNLEKYWQVNGLHYDVVFSHYWMSALVGKYLQGKYHLPYLAMYHTLGAVKNAIGIGGGEPALRINAEKETIADCRKIIVATEKEKQELSLFYDALPENISVIPCGVNMDIFQPVNKTLSRSILGFGSEKILLFVGRLDPLKGLDRLLQAVPLLKQQDNVRLIIIGGDETSREEVARLQNLSRELGINDKVTFQGLVKQDRLKYYYSAADVCVVPSYYESFGLVTLESLACGTPVVAANVGDLKNIVIDGKTGIIVPDNSPEHLADGISVVLSKMPTDPESAAAIRLSVIGWDWSQVAKKVISEMNNVTTDRLAPVV
jgi:D-inositol-3-phosphate glycosyltransferase